MMETNKPLNILPSAQSIGSYTAEMERNYMENKQNNEINITEEQLSTNEELEQDTPEEVSEEEESSSSRKDFLSSWS